MNAFLPVKMTAFSLLRMPLAGIRVYCTDIFFRITHGIGTVSVYGLKVNCVDHDLVEALSTLECSTGI